MKRILSTLSLLCLIASAAFSQNTLRGAYFLDGYNSAYKLNPALQSDRSFISIPVLGNANVMAESNIGLSSFLFPDGNGNLNTFLSESVSNEEFASGINDRNLLGVSENITLLGVGARVGKKYKTLDISLRTDVDANLPGDLFKFMKTGGSSINLSNMGVKANSFAEIAYGLSETVNDKFNIGVRVKGLLGLGAAETRFSEASITTGEDKWTATGTGYLQTAGALYYECDSEGKVDYDSFNATPDNLFKSFGAAIDFGFEYKINNHITVSGAVNDLGAMKWGNMNYAETSGKTWEFDGFDEISSDEGISDQIDEIKAELEDCFSLYGKDETGGGIKFLSPTFVAGAEFTPGMNGKFSAGLLATYHLDGAYSWCEGRLSANAAPGKAFSCSASAAVGTYGLSGGFALNVHARGIGLFIGTDNILPLTHVTTNYIPIGKLNTNLTVGLNIIFGEYLGKIRI